MPPAAPAFPVTWHRRARPVMRSYVQHDLGKRPQSAHDDMDSLERVTFDGCHNLTNEGVAALARLPHPRQLRVSGRGLTPGIASRSPRG